MDYKAHSHVLLNHGYACATGFLWLKLARTILTTGRGILSKAEWHNYRRNWGDDSKQPDIHTETTFDECVSLRVLGQKNGLLEFQLTIFDGDSFDGRRQEARCSFVLSDVSATDHDLEMLLRHHLRSVATIVLERKEDEARERLLRAEEDELLACAGPDKSYR